MMLVSAGAMSGWVGFEGKVLSNQPTNLDDDGRTTTTTNHDDDDHDGRRSMVNGTTIGF